MWYFGSDAETSTIKSKIYASKIMTWVFPFPSTSTVLESTVLVLSRSKHRRKRNRVLLSLEWINSELRCSSYKRTESQEETSVCIRNVPPLLSNSHVPFNMQYKAKAIYINSKSELWTY